MAGPSFTEREASQSSEMRPIDEVNLEEIADVVGGEINVKKLGGDKVLQIPGGLVEMRTIHRLQYKPRQALHIEIPGGEFNLEGAMVLGSRKEGFLTFVQPFHNYISGAPPHTPEYLTWVKISGRGIEIHSEHREFVDSSIWQAAEAASEANREFFLGSRLKHSA